MRKLGILATHPIQYYSPLFRELAAKRDLEFKVYYCHKPTAEEQGTGFGVSFQWDTDLLSGYPYEWLKNVSARPSLDRFDGCDTPGVADVLKNEKFDYFMLTGWNKRSFWQAMAAARQTRTRLLVRGDSRLSPRMSFLKAAVKRISYPGLMKRFETCLAVGTESEAYFRHYGAKKIVRSPHFVDNEWFARESAAVRQAHAAPVFLFSGKFEDKKRPLDFLKALERLSSERRHVSAVMAGDGDLRLSCERFAREKKLAVKFEGFVNQSAMPAVYASADVLVLPSDARETWGLVVNEAMACGLPAVVSSEAGCAPDLVREGETGYVFPCGDDAKLARAMRTFLDRPDRAAEMGRKASAFIADYSAANAAKGILQAMGMN